MATIEQKDIRLEFIRGPKSASPVATRLRHLPTGIVVWGEHPFSQSESTRLALRNLIAKLDENLDEYQHAKI